MPSAAEGKERLPSGSDDEMHVQILLLLSELFRRFIWHARNRTEDCFVIDPMDHSGPQPASMPAGDFSCNRSDSYVTCDRYRSNSLANRSAAVGEQSVRPGYPEGVRIFLTAGCLRLASGKVHPIH